MSGGNGLRTAEDFYKAGGIDTREPVIRTKLTVEITMDGTHDDAERLAEDIFSDERVSAVVVSIEAM